MNVHRSFLTLLIAGSSAIALGQSNPNAGGGTGGEAASGTGAATSARNAERSQASGARRENVQSSGAGGNHTAGKHQDGIMMRDGAVYFYKYGQPQKVEHELRLSEGITADPRGHVTLKDGRKLTLKEGEMVTLDGRVVTPQGTGVESRTSGAETRTGTGGRDIGAGSAGRGAREPDVSGRTGREPSGAEKPASGKKPQNQQR